MSLATKKMAARYRRHSTVTPPTSGVIAQAEEEVVDLFSRDRENNFFLYLLFSSHALLGLKSVLRHRLKLKPKYKSKRGKDKKDKVEELELRNLVEKHENEQERHDLESHDHPTADVQIPPVADSPIAISPSSPLPGPSPKMANGLPLERSTSANSTRSKVSAKSNKSSKSKRTLPTFDPPAAVQRDTDDSDADEEYEDHAFDHPSTFVFRVLV
jgi:hypothetical protein